MSSCFHNGHVCFFTSYQDNRTALYWASCRGHKDVVQTLLGAGADVNIARSDVSYVMFYYYIVHSYVLIISMITHKPYNYSNNHSSTFTCT